MILVDTSVWIRHLRYGDSQLAELLRRDAVAGHPMVIGELACGNMADRDAVLECLEALPAAEVADHQEVLWFINQNELMGQGLGYIDVHLLASCKLSGARLWTADRRLKAAATGLECCHQG